MGNNNSKNIKIFYEVNPAFFYDSNNDGYGDIQGLTKKIKYFEYLGIDYLIIPNLLKAYQNNRFKNYREINRAIGSINDFENLVKASQNINVSIVIDLNINDADKCRDWLKQATKDKQDVVQDNQDKFSDVDPLYFVDTVTKEIRVNWSNADVLSVFLDVAKYWVDLGVRGFVLSDFEKVLFDYSDKKPKIKENILSNLKIFCSEIVTYAKLKGFSLIMIARAHSLQIDLMNRLTKGPDRLFHRIITTSISKLGTHKKLGIDKIHRFQIKNLYHEIERWRNMEGFVLSFGSSLVGRIVSRWGSEKTEHKQAAKTYAIWLMLSGLSFSIYYGDEIGMTNIGLNPLDNYQDEKMVERKNYLQVHKRVKDKQFYEAQRLQNPINSANPMQWSDRPNAGFSTNNLTVVPISKNYKYINVQQQYYDDSSILVFYRFLTHLVKREDFRSFITNAQKSVIWTMNSFNANYFGYRFRNGTQTISVFTNASKRKIKFKPPRKSWLLLSSYADFNYSTPFTYLYPFETLVFWQDPVLLESKEVFGIKVKKVWFKKDFKDKQLAQQALTAQKNRDQASKFHNTHQSEWTLETIVKRRKKDLSSMIYLTVFKPKNKEQTPKNVEDATSEERVLIQPTTTQETNAMIINKDNLAQLDSSIKDKTSNKDEAEEQQGVQSRDHKSKSDIDSDVPFDYTLCEEKTRDVLLSQPETEITVQKFYPLNPQLLIEENSLNKIASPQENELEVQELKLPTSEILIKEKKSATLNISSAPLKKQVFLPQNSLDQTQISHSKELILDSDVLQSPTTIIEVKPEEQPEKQLMPDSNVELPTAETTIEPEESNPFAIEGTTEPIEESESEAEEHIATESIDKIQTKLEQSESFPTQEFTNQTKEIKSEEQPEEQLVPDSNVELPTTETLVEPDITLTNEMDDYSLDTKEITAPRGINNAFDTSEFAAMDAIVNRRSSQVKEMTFPVHDYKEKKVKETTEINKEENENS